MHGTAQIHSHKVRFCPDSWSIELQAREIGNTGLRLVAVQHAIDGETSLRERGRQESLGQIRDTYWRYDKPANLS